jgi:hypothetical protein
MVMACQFGHQHQTQQEFLMVDVDADAHTNMSPSVKENIAAFVNGVFPFQSPERRIAVAIMQEAFPNLARLTLEEMYMSFIMVQQTTRKVPSV